MLSVHHRQRRQDQNASSKCRVEKPECEPFEFHRRFHEGVVDPQIEHQQPEQRNSRTNTVRKQGRVFQQIMVK